MEEIKTNNLFSDFESISNQQWRDLIEKDLKGADFTKKLVWNSIEGIDLQPYYRKDDIDNLSYLKTNSKEFPFVRGVKTKSNKWRIREFIYNSNVDEISRAIKDGIRSGVNSFTIPVNKISDSNQLSSIFRNVQVADLELNFISGTSYPVFLNYLQEVFDYDIIKGSIDFDVMSYYFNYGAFYQSKEYCFDELSHIIEVCSKNFPRIKCIGINAIDFHNAGANSTQELAFAFSSAIETIEELLKRGHNIEEIVKNIKFNFGVGSDYFIEIGKFRAARVIWANILKGYGINPESKLMTMDIHCRTSNVNKTIYDPYVNMLRLTTEAMSATIGGCDSLTVQPFDNSYRTPDSFSLRMARNLQMLLKEEAGFENIVDPSSGSYYIETITDKLVDNVWTLFVEIENEGGLLESARKGLVHKRIEEVVNKRLKDIFTRKRSIIGTNQYPNIDEKVLDDIKLVKKGRLTEGNIEIEPLKPLRIAESFEKLRLATEKFVKKGGKKPVVFLLTYGSPSMRTARATFTSNFYGCLGYDIINNLGFENVLSGAKEALKQRADIVVLCSSDEEYLNNSKIVSDYFIQNDFKTQLIVAGNPIDDIENLKSEGVNDFIHARCNLYESLFKYQRIFSIC